MCGIAGFSLTEQDAADPMNSYWLSFGLLGGIEKRGKDATGYAAVNNTKRQIDYFKTADTASKFIGRDEFELLRDRHTVLLHTRAATQGSTHDNRNNHPIVTTGVVGVHNGIVDNDYEIFKAKGWDRVGEVDSEVLFKYIEEEGLRQMVKAVEGDAAIAYIRYNEDADINVVNLASLGGRPVGYGQTEGGSIVFASTEADIKEAAQLAEIELLWTKNLAEGMAMSVKRGVILKDPWRVGPLKARSWAGYQYGNLHTGGASHKVSSHPTPIVCKGCTRTLDYCMCHLTGGIVASTQGWDSDPRIVRWENRNDVYKDKKKPHLNGSWVGANYYVEGFVVPLDVWNKWKLDTETLQIEADEQQAMIEREEAKARRDQILVELDDPKWDMDLWEEVCEAHRENVVFKIYGTYFELVDEYKLESVEARDVDFAGASIYGFDEWKRKLKLDEKGGDDRPLMWWLNPGPDTIVYAIEWVDEARTEFHQYGDEKWVISMVDDEVFDVKEIKEKASIDDVAFAMTYSPMFGKLLVTNGEGGLTQLALEGI